MATPTVWTNPYRKRFNEIPLTIIKDLYDTLKVELIERPQITGALREFVECGSMSQAPNFQEVGTSLTQLVKENALWQGLETLHFTFKVTGCSRMLTHQLVRHRIGVTFSQQCSDSVDWRHQNIVLPRVIPLYVIPSLLHLKTLYANQIDSRLVSCQEARYLLPQCLETFIYLHVSLATLIQMIQKRACTMTQPWETYLWATKTRGAVLAYFPIFASLFESACSEMRCFYHKAKKNPTSAYLYQPDYGHGNFDWNPDSYIYPKTHNEMSIPDEIEHIMHQFYLGEDQITREKYVEYAKEYGLCQSS